MPKNGSDYSHIPIPSYDEATSSRPDSPQPHRTQLASDAERQTLIGSTSQRSAPTTNGGYRPPTVESARSSFESVTTLSSNGTSNDEQELRRDMEEMEIDDGAASSTRRSAQQRARHLRNKFFASITSSFHSFSLPTLPSPFGGLRERLPSWPERLKPTFPIIARLVAISIIVAGIYVLMIMGIFGSPRGLIGPQYLPESIRAFAQENIDGARMEQHLRQLTFDDHIAGTRGDFFLANWVKRTFEEYRLDTVSSEDYEVYLNYPGSRSVAIEEPDELRWGVPLEEDRINPDLDQHQAPTFHGHSADGEVKAPLVYANYGLAGDFEWLASIGVNVTGAIIIIRAYGYEPELAQKVLNAQRAGAIGVLVYTDPKDDLFAHDHPDTVHRGSVSLTSHVLGDPLTPGWPSLPDTERLEIPSWESQTPSGNRLLKQSDMPSGLVAIPSLPLSWRDAKPLLSSLASHGIPVPNNWAGSVPGVDTYFTGNTSTSPTISMSNRNDIAAKQPIRNIHSMIQGFEDGRIYIGAPRDAFCFGAADAGVSTAVLLETARVFGELISIGWRPRRSIFFVSWDASAYNLAGSTEHVEKYADELRGQAIAYINIGSATGSQVHATGSPLFSRPLLHALDRVTDPSTNESLRQSWSSREASIAAPAAAADYAAWQHIAGTSVLDIGFGPHPNDDHPRRHPSDGTCHDTLAYLLHTSDPGLAHTTALAQVITLLALELADDRLLSFDFTNYAHAVADHVDALSSAIPSSAKIDLTPLRAASSLFLNTSAAFNQWGVTWHEQTMLLPGGAPESVEGSALRRAHNARMSEFETHLLDLPGVYFEDNDDDEDIPHPHPHPQPYHRSRSFEERAASQRDKGGLKLRPQYKHTLFAPSLGNKAIAAWFPAIRDALDQKDWEGVRDAVRITARTLRHAARKLTQGEDT